MRVLIGVAIFASSFLTSCSSETNKSEVAIKEVTIGKQVWTSENLNVTVFSNGEPIPQAKSALDWQEAERNKKPICGYIEGDSINYGKYGKIYNWYAVTDPRGLAPKGYHVPSKEEWQQLIDHLGKKEAGKKLKSKTGWGDGNPNYNTGTNETGFNALPGGNYSIGSFFGVKFFGYFWASSQVDIDRADFYYVGGQFYSMEYGVDSKSCGFSVRCIKDK